MEKVQRESWLVRLAVNMEHRRTNIRLEPYLCEALREIAAEKGLTVAQLCSCIDKEKPNPMGLTSAVRIFIVAYYREGRRILRS